MFLTLGMYNFDIVAALNAFAAFCTKISNMFLLQSLVVFSGWTLNETPLSMRHCNLNVFVYLNLALKFSEIFLWQKMFNEDK